jgi:hypothetical protein
MAIESRIPVVARGPCIRQRCRIFPGKEFIENERFDRGLNFRLIIMVYPPTVGLTELISFATPC